MRRARKRLRRQRRQLKRQRRRQRRQPQTWLDCVHYFLTSHCWRLAHRAADPFQAVRWKLLPLLLIGMIALLCPEHAAKDRFATARDYYVAMYPHGKRPGTTHAGFLEALARLPRRVFKYLLPVLRRRTAQVLQRAWTVEGWTPFGVDGSRLALPRCPELERHFGTAGSGDFPHLWITSIVHLVTGVPWAWRFGRSNASERQHCAALLSTLPKRSLLVADAGFVGYPTWASLLAQRQHFVMRVASNVRLYADFEVRANFREGRVYLWPIRTPSKKPLALRLVRLPAEVPGQPDVWLATSTTAKQLSRKSIDTLFRLRWQHEVFYRSYKCTLRRAKLSSRTTRQVLREAELTMLAVQLFAAHAAWAVSKRTPARPASCAEALRQVRREWRDVMKRGRLRPGFLRRLGRACREHRPHRKTPKNQRTWPHKRRYKPPSPPLIAAYPEELKARLRKEDMAA